MTDYLETLLERQEEALAEEETALLTQHRRESAAARKRIAAQERAAMQEQAAQSRTSVRERTAARGGAAYYNVSVNQGLSSGLWDVSSPLLGMPESAQSGMDMQEGQSLLGQSAGLLA